MTPPARRALFTVILFFAACAIAGSVMQSRVGAQSSADESQLRDSLKSFTNVYALVEQNYAEPITGDKADLAIYDGAIPGMLRVLDPHSNFYDPKAYARMREDQHGRYYGVGMVIQQQLTKIYVITPYEGTPSYRAGIHPATPCNRLTPRQWTKLRTEMREVLHEALCEQGSTLSDNIYATPEGDPGQYAFRVYQRHGKPCLRCGKAEIERIVQSQRSTFFCPRCQPVIASCAAIES